MPDRPTILCVAGCTSLKRTLGRGRRPFPHWHSSLSLKAVTSRRWKAYVTIGAEDAFQDQHKHLLCSKSLEEKSKVDSWESSVLPGYSCKCLQWSKCPNHKAAFTGNPVVKSGPRAARFPRSLEHMFESAEPTGNWWVRTGPDRLDWQSDLLPHCLHLLHHKLGTDFTNHGGFTFMWLLCIIIIRLTQRVGMKRSSKAISPHSPEMLNCLKHWLLSQHKAVRSFVRRYVRRYKPWIKTLFYPMVHDSCSPPLRRYKPWIKTCFIYIQCFTISEQSDVASDVTNHESKHVLLSSVEWPSLDHKWIKWIQQYPTMVTSDHNPQAIHCLILAEIARPRRPDQHDVVRRKRSCPITGIAVKNKRQKESERQERKLMRDSVRERSESEKPGSWPCFLFFVFPACVSVWLESVYIADVYIDRLVCTSRFVIHGFINADYAIGSCSAAFNSFAGGVLQSVRM